MNRFKLGSAILAALLFLSEAKAVFASTINYLDLSAESYNGGDSVGQVSGTLTYNSTTGATASIGSGGGTTYSEPTALGLTSATIKTSSSDSIDACDPGGCSIGTVTSSALATGDLATGSVGVYSIPSQVGAVVSEATATAILKDSLTFNVAGANSSTITDIGVTFTVDGLVSYAASAAAQLNEIITLGCGTSTCGEISYGFNGGSNQIIEDGGWVSQNIISESADSFIFSGVYALSGSSDVLPIELELKAECQGDASCDLSHTGAVGFTLPSNVTFTSQSGVFLTQPLTTATPEPSYAAVIGLGIGGIVMLTRRRQHRRGRQN
jgi:hypothetical protein